MWERPGAEGVDRCFKWSHCPVFEGLRLEQSSAELLGLCSALLCGPFLLARMVLKAPLWLQYYTKDFFLNSYRHRKGGTEKLVRGRAVNQKKSVPLENLVWSAFSLPTLLCFEQGRPSQPDLGMHFQCWLMEQKNEVHGESLTPEGCCAFPWGFLQVLLYQILLFLPFMSEGLLLIPKDALDTPASAQILPVNGVIDCMST